jgi:integrase
MPKHAAQEFTKPFIDSLPAGKKGGTWYSDAEVRGLCLRVYPGGAKVFFVRYMAGRRRRVYGIGPYGKVTLAKARKSGLALLGRVAGGADPAAEKERASQVPTFGEWVDTYLSRVRVENKDPRSYEKFLGSKSPKGRALRARWGKRPLDSITSEDVSAFRDNLRVERIRKEKRSASDSGDPGAPPPPQKGPPATTANRWTGAVRACFSAAVRAGHVRSNPAKGLKMLREAPPRSRVLSTEEMGRFLSKLEAEPDPYVRAAFRLLVETGARLSEVLHARWEDIDREAGLWRIPSPKSGHPQVVPLGSRTVGMLERLPPNGPFIIVGKDPKKPRADLKTPWDRLRTHSELGDVRVHDIRRSFGLAVAKAAGLHIASKLLRHSSIKVTEQVYAPLGIEDLRAAVERRADVLPFPKQSNE